MKYGLCLTLGALFVSMPAWATPGWDEPSHSAMPQAEMSYGLVPAPSSGERRQMQAAAQLPSPNGPANVIPNGPVTANPPGAGASSQATLTEHGEQGTAASSNIAATSSGAGNSR